MTSVYIRRETTTAILNLTPRELLAQRFNDIIIYADIGCTKFMARIPWYYSDKPRKKSTTLMLNCWLWSIVWVE